MSFDTIALMKTTVVFKSAARTELIKGLTVVADAVGCTLGPKGKTVAIQQRDALPIVTKDGVTVAKAINLKDPIQCIGAQLLKQAAERTNELAGDGTTTSTVLAKSLVIEGNKCIVNQNNPRAIVRGINVAVEHVIQQVKLMSKKIESFDEIAQVATISANGDKEIGKLIADAMQRVGKDGIITVEDAKGTLTSLDVVEGLRFDRGYLSPYFVTSNEKMHATYENCRVLICDRKISSLQQLIPVLEKVIAARQSLLIIADDVEAEALNGLVLNRTKASMPVVAVRAPSFGLYRDSILNDLCVITKSKLVSSKTGLSLEKLELTDLGVCKRIIVDSKTTTLVSQGNDEAVKNRIAELSSQLEDITLSPEELSGLKQRIAGMSSGVAVVRVGGATEVEMLERRHRIEDALHAARVAAEEGIIPGAGTALLKAAQLLDIVLEGDAKLGVDIVKRACEAPLRQIVLNGDGMPDVIVNQALQHIDNKNVGYDAMSGEFKDLYEAGIVDPVKVCRTALLHAASVATTFLMLDAVIYEDQ